MCTCVCRWRKRRSLSSFPVQYNCGCIPAPSPSSQCFPGGGEGNTDTVRGLKKHGLRGLYRWSTGEKTVPHFFFSSRSIQSAVLGMLIMLIKVIMVIYLKHLSFLLDTSLLSSLRVRYTVFHIPRDQLPPYNSCVPLFQTCFNLFQPCFNLFTYVTYVTYLHGGRDDAERFHRTAINAGTGAPVTVTVRVPGASRRGGEKRRGGRRRRRGRRRRERRR